MSRGRREPSISCEGTRAAERAALRAAGSALVGALILASVVGCDDLGSSESLTKSRLPRYEVSERPVLVLAEDGSEEKLFSRISARRMPTGEVIVADQGASSVHAFGRDGRLLRTLARRGDGPGELNGDVRLTSRDDTIFTFGRPPMSPPDVNVFLAGRGFLSRSRPRADSARMLTVFDRLSTGHLVVRRGTVFKILNSAPEIGSLIPDTAVYGLFSAREAETGGDVVWLPPVVLQWYFVYPWRGSRLRSGMGPYVLGPTTMMVASGNQVWLIDGDSGQLRAFDGRGQEVIARRLSLKPQPFDRTLLGQRHARELASATRALDSAKVEAMYDPDLLPATMPVFSAAHAGPDGELWLRLFDLEDTAPPRFVVVDRNGAEIAQATLPPNLEVQQIGIDFVLGVRVDSLGVPSVLEYALRRR